MTTPMHQEVKKMATGFVKNYKQTMVLYDQALEEGWAYDLMAFVEDHARIQARAIIGIPGSPYDPNANGYLTWCKDPKALVRQSAAYAKEGRRPHVIVPVEAITYWQKKAGVLKPKNESATKQQSKNIDSWASGDLWGASGVKNDAKELNVELAL